MKVYLAGPMTGLTVREAKARRQEVKLRFMEWGHRVRCPLRGEEGDDQVIGAAGEESYAPPRAVYERDLADVRWCDVLFLDLTDATRVSIGSMKEQTWGKALNKYVVLVDPLWGQGSIHDHLFTEYEASVIFTDRDDAIDYLIKTYAEDER